METIELVSKLILAFILFSGLGISATLFLLKIFFKPLTEQQLREWKTEELREWKPVQRNIKTKDHYHPIYTQHRKAS